MRAIIMGAASVALALSLSACNVIDMVTGAFSSAKDISEPGQAWRYKADIMITIGDKTFEGMAATKLEGPLTFAIESKVRLDRLEISSCSRHVVHEKVDKNWYGGVGKRFTYTYTPNQIEADGLCPIFIQAFDRAGLSAWGYIGFRSDETLASKVSCNGIGWTFAGYTVCQTKAGYIQSIHFDSAIKHFEADESCGLSRKSPGDFELKPNAGFCYATFNDGAKWHRATFLGYQTVLTRGE